MELNRQKKKQMQKWHREERGDDKWGLIILRSLNLQGREDKYQ